MNTGERVQAAQDPPDMDQDSPDLQPKPPAFLPEAGNVQEEPDLSLQRYVNQNPPNLQKISPDVPQKPSSIHSEPTKRRSMVQSLPSDYSDVQPKSYDPEFIFDISNKMQVPDTIGVGAGTIGDYDRYKSQSGWEGVVSQRNVMRVPEKIMVAGGGQHIGARHEMRPLHLDDFAASRNEIVYELVTPPRVLTVEEQFPNVHVEEEEDDEPPRVPNGAVQLVQTPQTPGQMSDSLIYYDEDQAQLRNQLIKLSRRVALMEKEQQTLSNWIKLTYAAAIGYFILKIAFWSK